MAHVIAVEEGLFPLRKRAGFILVAGIALFATACSTVQQSAMAPTSQPPPSSPVASSSEIAPELRKAVGVYEGFGDMIVIQEWGNTLTVDYYGFGKHKLDTENTLSVNRGIVHLQVANLLIRASGIVVTLELDLYGDVFLGTIYTKGVPRSSRFDRVR